MRYNMVSQRWKDDVADDGPPLKVQPIVIRVAKNLLNSVTGVNQSIGLRFEVQLK
jgi:hypothetical protein